MSKSLKQCSIKSNKIPPTKSTRLRHVNTSSAVKRRSTALLLSSGALKVAYRRPVLDQNSSNFMTSLSFAVVWYILQNRFKNVFIETPEIFIQTYGRVAVFSLWAHGLVSVQPIRDTKVLPHWDVGRANLPQPPRATVSRSNPSQRHPHPSKFTVDWADWYE